MLRPQSASRKMSVEIYTDAAGEYRWRLNGVNKAAVAGSSQSYKNLENCQSIVDSLEAEFKTTNLKSTRTSQTVGSSASRTRTIIS